MGRMKAIYLAFIEDPAVQELIELQEWRDPPNEPELPDPTWTASAEPPEGSVFDPDTFIPF
jgi:hypothetical protein